MKIFEILDSKAEGFSTPFFAETTGLAMRLLKQRIQDSDQMALYAADFSLYETADWDAQSGITVGLAEPLFVIQLENLLDLPKEPTPNAE